MSDLSRSLVDAAAEAMRLERVRCLRETSRSASAEQEAAAGVAAVLEVLDDEVLKRILADEEPIALRRLAAEVKTGEGR